LSIEVDLLSVHHEREVGGGSLEGRGTGVFGSLVYHFGNGRTQVFAMGSAGMLKARRTNTFQTGGENRVITSDATDFAWGGGAGVKVFATPRFSIRPQLRIVFSEATGVMGLVASSVVAGYHW
jgi:hypothetical protein